MSLEKSEAASHQKGCCLALFTIKYQIDIYNLSGLLFHESKLELVLMEIFPTNCIIDIKCFHTNSLLSTPYLKPI